MGRQEHIDTRCGDLIPYHAAADQTHHERRRTQYASPFRVPSPRGPHQGFLFAAKLAARREAQNPGVIQRTRQVRGIAFLGILGSRCLPFRGPLAQGQLRPSADSLCDRLLQPSAQRLDKELQRLQPIPDQLVAEQKKFLESQKLADVERDRQMGIWEQTITEQKTTLERQTVQMREFEARYEQAGRSLKGIEEFQAQMVREQKQIAELQRLAEERQRKELADWQAENEQRWKKEGLRADYISQEQQKVNQKLIDRFIPLEKQLAVAQREIEALWRLHEALGAQQSQGSQRLMDAIGAAMGARPKPEA